MIGVGVALADGALPVPRLAKSVELLQHHPPPSQWRPQNQYLSSCSLAVQNPAPTLFPSSPLTFWPPGKPVKKLPADTTVALTDSTAELYKRLAAATGLSVHRLRLAKGSDGSVIPNSTKILVSETGLRQKSNITVKDLGTLPLSFSPQQ